MGIPSLTLALFYQKLLSINRKFSKFIPQKQKASNLSYLLFQLSYHEL